MKQLNPTEVDVTAALIEKGGMYEYVRAFWPIVEPGTEFIDAWHIGAMCAFAEASIIDREVKRGYVNIPPRMAKSTFWSVLAQSYKWTKQPDHLFTAASYDLGLVRRDGGRLIDVVNSPLHQAIFPHVQIKGKIPAQSNFETTEGGRRFGTTPRSKGTGWGSETQVMDDLLSAAQAQSAKERERVATWVMQTMANRISRNPANFVRLIVMQRLHADDPTGLAKELGWEGLVLPMGERDSRGKWVEVLFPELWDAALVAAMAEELGSEMAVQAQMQQDPTPDTGGFIEKPWIRRFDDLPLRPQFLRWFQVWDLGFKGTKDSQSRVAGILCFMHQDNVYVWDYVASHLNYPSTREKLLELNQREDWGRAGAIYVEDAANGPALIADLKTPMRGLPTSEQEHWRKVARKLQPFNPGRIKGQKVALSKEEMVKLQSDKIRSGRLFIREGLDEIVTEVCGFPNARYDDLTDVICRALALLTVGKLKNKSAVLQKILGR